MEHVRTIIAERNIMEHVRTTMEYPPIVPKDLGLTFHRIQRLRVNNVRDDATYKEWNTLASLGKALSVTSQFRRHF